MKWFIKCFKQYADFSGRARRKEYWWFTLINFIIGLLLSFGYLPQYMDFVSSASEGAAPDMHQMFAIYSSPFYIIATIYSLAALIPGLAVWTRRLHDTGRSGWWILILFVLLGVLAFVAGIGAASGKAWLCFLAVVLVLALIVLNIVWLFLDSNPGENKYGPNPKEMENGKF